MGRRGPPPKPTALRLLEGNASKRPLNRREPNPEPGRPVCPSWLLPEAKAEWRRIVPALERMGVLARVDRPALEGYCQAYARWRDAELQLTKYGWMIQTPSGYVQQGPFVSIVQRQILIMKQFLAELGLTPSARSRIVTPTAPATDNPFLELMRGNSTGS